MENAYYEFIQLTVNANLREAARGAIPGTEQLIQSFLNIRRANFAALEDGNIWPMIYYALRCGHVHAAVDVARKNAQVLGEFLPSLIEWTESPDRMLGPNQESKLKIQYRR